MGRNVRRVPPSWDHPRDANGHYIPMDEHFLYCPDEVVEGLRDGWLRGDPPNYGTNVMPQWPDAERTHFQMYETTSEGTPISPPCDSPTSLARWLADNGASAMGNETATFEQWLAMIRAGSAVTMVFDPTHGLRSGVAAMSDPEMRRNDA